MLSEVLRLVRATYARMMAKGFADIGFMFTSKWIIFSLENPESSFAIDIQDIINAFRSEFRLYKGDFFDDPQYNDECTEKVLNIVVKAMNVDRKQFRELTTKLKSLNERVTENGKSIDYLTANIQNLGLEEKFRRYCQFYQLQWEGDYKFIKKSLLAMNSLDINQKIEVTKTLAITMSNKNIESTVAFDKVLPLRLQASEHVHLRNSIAHYNNRFLKEEEKMEFWDIETRSQNYSWGPKKYSFEEFLKPLFEVYLFCQAFSLTVMLLMALSDLNKP
jgi:hypothetical protein